MIGGDEDAFVKRLFGNLVLAAVVVAVLSFFAAPAVAFFAIRSAAEANDVAGLARLIDFNAVRQSEHFASFFVFAVLHAALGIAARAVRKPPSSSSVSSKSPRANSAWTPPNSVARIS